LLLHYQWTLLVSSQASLRKAAEGPERLRGEKRSLGPVPGPCDQRLPHARPGPAYSVLSKMTVALVGRAYSHRTFL
jgi:hypothetical protein